MKRCVLGMMLMMAGLTAACGSDNQEWQFEDKETVFVEDVVVGPDGRPVERPDDQRPGGQQGDRPEITDFVRPDYVEPSMVGVACDTELTEYTVPSTIEGVLRSGRGDIDELPCATGYGRERRYRLVIDEPTSVRIWTDYQTTQFSPILLLQAGCGDNATDLYCSSPLYSHPGDANGNLQARLEPGVYTLTIDERNNLEFGEGGAFKVFIEETELAPNGMCEQASDLAPGDILTITDAMTGGTASLAGCFSGNSLSRFWRIKVPARSSARVRTEYVDDDPVRRQGPGITIRESCEEFCEGPYGSGSVSLANTSSESVEYVVRVSDSRDLPYRVWLEGYTPLADNSQCETPLVLEPNDWVRGNPAEGSEQAPLCGGDPVRQLYFQVDVPPNHRLLTQADGTGLVAYESCIDRICMFNPVNRSNSTQRFILATGSRSEEPFQLSPRVVELAENSSCLTPAPLALGSREWGYNTRGGDVRGTCDLIFADGFTHWYSATIPAGATYEVRVERIDGPNLNVEVVEGGCQGTCLETWDAYFYGPTDPTVPIVNDGAQPRDVLIAVTPDGQTEPFGDGYFTVELVDPNE